jgi:hypothetical protein
MKKVSIFMLLLLMITGSLVQSQTLEDVLKKHFAAIGQEKRVTVNTMKVSGKMTRGGIETPIIEMAKRPDLFRVEVTFTGSGSNNSSTFNGKEGWIIAPSSGSTVPQPLEDYDLKSIRYRADMDGMLWNWKEKGYTVTLEGNEDMEGTSCYKVKLVTKDNDSFTYYLDSDSYMILRTNRKLKVQGDEIESDIYYSNYMQVEGLTVPGKVDYKMDGQIVGTSITDKVEINPELDKGLFEKPIK